MNVKLGEQLAQPCPEGGENHRRAEREVQCLPDARGIVCAVVGRQNRLCCLPDAVGAALDKGRDVDNGCVDRKCVGVEVFHDLAVKEHRENAHGNVDKEAGKAGDSNFSEFFEELLYGHQMQRASSGEKVRTHDCKRDHGAGRRGKPCAEHAKVQHEHAEPVAKHIENAAGQHCRRGKTRSCVVSQEA